MVCVIVGMVMCNGRCGNGVIVGAVWAVIIGVILYVIGRGNEVSQRCEWVW